MRTPLALLAALLVVLYAAVAGAFHPPPLRGHVVDTAGALSAEEVTRLDAKLDAARKSSGFAVVVFITASLEGESIEDVSYQTAKTWGVGSKEGDDGVVLVIAPKERKIRIETGKGVGGALTDVECSHIIRDAIGPHMKQGKVFEAVDAGTDRILSALVSGTPGGASAPGKANGKRGSDPVGTIVGLVIFGVFFLVAAVIGVVTLLAFRRGGGSGGTSSGSSSSWSSSDSSSSSWSSSDSSSGYSGGGGDFGGGGASGDY